MARRIFKQGEVMRKILGSFLFGLLLLSAQMSFGQEHHAPVDSGVGRPFFMVIANDSKLLSRFLELGGSPNARFSDGNSLLSRACGNETFDCVKLLLDADVDIEATSGQPVLVSAFIRSSNELLPMLLSHGADPNVRLPETEETLLHIIASGMVVSEILGEEGNDVTSLTPNARIIYGKLVDKENALILLLKDKGADLTIVDSNGATPLDVAKSHGLERMFQSLTPAPGKKGLFDDFKEARDRWEMKRIQEVDQE